MRLVSFNSLFDGATGLLTDAESDLTAISIAGTKVSDVHDVERGSVSFGRRTQGTAEAGNAMVHPRNVAWPNACPGKPPVRIDGGDASDYVCPAALIR